MRTDAIEAIGIDGVGSLWVKPRTTTFAMIYREAMGVHWDTQRLCLHGSPPREFPYLDFTPAQWFSQILAAAREQGITLQIDGYTRWVNIEGNLREEIVAC